MVRMAQFPPSTREIRAGVLSVPPSVWVEMAGQGKARDLATTSKPPHRVSGQVERETELAELSGPAIAACPGFGAIVLIEGLVGIGKTELRTPPAPRPNAPCRRRWPAGNVSQPRAHVCPERGQNNAGQHHNCRSQ
jgi:hypothetical protein